MRNVLRDSSIGAWEWFRGRAHGSHAQAWLFALSFSESSFFLIPPDVLLIAMLAAGAQRWIYLATLTSVASILGAVFGYLIGFFVFEPVAQPIVEFYHLAEEFAYVGTLYAGSTFWVVLAAAFTPIPYKVFVLSGGFFAVPFIPFILATVIGRSARFLLVAWLAYRYGSRAAELFIAHFNKATVAVVVAVAIFVAIHFDLLGHIFN